MGDALERLLQLRQGHFEFESGHHGDLWIDLDGLLERPRRLQPYVEDLARRLATWRIEMICGPLTGGAFLAQLIARELDTGFCFAERHGDGYRITATMRASVEGKRVAVVDDAINAGSAVSATLRDVRACGGMPFAIGSLIALGNAAARLADEQALAIECIIRRPANLWESGKCPLCASGVVLDRP